MWSEQYINRLRELCGIIQEVTDIERNAAFAKSNERVPFNRQMMADAIRTGKEIGILFQSNNEKYKMPIPKYRIIYPVAMGISKKGNLVVRAFHKMGQSESEARKLHQRSAEVENEWRLFKTENIKSMWWTGRWFRGPLELYNPVTDKGMTSVEVQANFADIIKYQEDMLKNSTDEKDQLQKQKNIVNLFKDTGERPVEQPIQNPTQQVTPQVAQQDKQAGKIPSLPGNKKPKLPGNNTISESFKSRMQQLSGIRR